MIIPQINFIFDRLKRATPTKQGVIELRITYNRKQKYIVTGVKCFNGQWDAAKECIRSVSQLEDNALLLKIRQKALKVIGRMVDKGSIDLEAITKLIKTNDVDITFIDYIVKRARNKNVVDYTKMTYGSFVRKLEEYGKIKFFSDINEKAIRDFDEWLHSYTWTEKDKYGRNVRKHYSQATIGSYHKNLKNFIADAVIDGFLTENVYVTKKIKVSKGEARIDRYLTPQELKQIEDAKMPLKSISEARDLFVFACHTGLSFVDLMAFDAGKISREGSVKIYKDKRHKTGVAFVAPITKKAEEILKRYKNHLPKLPNQKYNARLKLVADAALIDKPITSHYSRHTAASVWMNEGIPIEIISKALGHSNTMQTERVYSKMFDKTIADAFKKIK